MGLKKITSDDLENTILNPLENYLSSFKSEYTKERYTRILKGYMMNTLSDLIDGETFEEKVVSLVNKARKDPQCHQPQCHIHSPADEAFARS